MALVAPLASALLSPRPPSVRVNVTSNTQGGWGVGGYTSAGVKEKGGVGESADHESGEYVMPWMEGGFEDDCVTDTILKQLDDSERSSASESDSEIEIEIGKTDDACVLSVFIA